MRYVLSELSSDFPIPIVIVQHMPEGFTAEFAHSLNKFISLEVKEAETGDRIKPGRILIAPGSSHLKVEKKRLGAVVSLENSISVNGHIPSAGVLFKSVAREYGKESIGIIMTGMGKDGAFEIGEIQKAGGITLAQDMKSCVVFGMPKVAIEQDNIDGVVTLEDMADTLNQIVNYKI